MDAGFVTLSLAIVGFAAGSVKMYVDNVDLKRENEHLKEKNEELREQVRRSK